MIDFSKVEPLRRVDTAFILSKLSQEQIFYFYFGAFKLNVAYPSIFRKDSNPSTGFYINKYGNIIYNDLKTGEKLNCFSFVMKRYTLSFIEALNRIALDFGLTKSGTANPIANDILNKSIDFDREAKKETLIQVRPGSWTSERAKYWKQYYITYDELKREEVYPIDRLWINKAEIKVDELCFAYVVRVKAKGKEPAREYIKIYQPYSDRMKWISNVPLTVPFGLDKLKYGDHLVIGKAQKDRIILLKFFESVIGTQNESESALSNTLIKHLSFHFPQRTIIWDSDETGVENCTKFNERGFGYFNTPKELLELGIKDVSDYAKAYGIQALEKLFRSKNMI